MDRDTAWKLVQPARLFIGGRFEDAADGARGPVEDPSRAVQLTETALAGAADVDRAVRAARAAFDGGTWPALDARDRGHLLLKLAALLKLDGEAMAAAEAINGGKPFGVARTHEVAAAIEGLTFFAGLADKIEGRVIPVRGPDRCFTRREPAGVVGAIISWDRPLVRLAAKIAAPLAAGCCVVVKVSALTPLSAHRLALLIEAAGFPPGVVNILPGLGETAGRALVEHPLVDAVTFTGRTATGRDVLARAGAQLKRCAVELGGKSPQIVFADAGDPATLAQALTCAYTTNAGQSPTAGSRILVERSFYDTLLPRLVLSANNLVAGCPFDRRVVLGPLISAQQLARVEGFVARARESGARIVAGGERLDLPDLPGHFHRATVVTQAPADAEIVREEVFGPVCVVMPFDDEAQAVALAHSTHHGLAAGIWTRDTSRAQRLAQQLRAGTVWINGYDSSDPAAPSNGRRDSGFGTNTGPEALEFYTQPKTIWMRAT